MYQIFYRSDFENEEFFDDMMDQFLQDLQSDSCTPHQINEIEVELLALNFWDEKGKKIGP